MLKRIGFLIALMTLAACAASVRSVVTSPGIRLRQYDPVFLVLRAASGNVGLTGGQVAGVVTGSVSDGDKQGALALESLRFELVAMGFRLVNDRQSASAVVEFAIGSIRYDPLAGWIADQALASFIDVRTGETLASFRADARAITPTVNRLVGSLSKAIREAVLTVMKALRVFPREMRWRVIPTNGFECRHIAGVLLSLAIAKYSIHSKDAEHAEFSF